MYASGRWCRFLGAVTVFWYCIPGRAIRGLEQKKPPQEGSRGILFRGGQASEGERISFSGGAQTARHRECVCAQELILQPSLRCCGRSGVLSDPCCKYPPHEVSSFAVFLLNLWVLRVGCREVISIWWVAVFIVRLWVRLVAVATRCVQGIVSGGCCFVMAF